MPADPVTVAVIGSALTATAAEMSEALHRSAYSPIIREMLDYSCAVFTPEGETVAQAENIPALLGSMAIALQAIVADGIGDPPAAGDIYIANDPYRGGTHTPDIHIFAPVFDTGRLIAWTGTLAHHADIGGTNPGTEGYANRTIFEEGLRFPGIRLFEGGRPVEPLFRYIEANVREPRATLGDLRAQVAAVKLGGLRVVELGGKYGLQTLSAAMTGLLDQAERRLRARIAERPADPRAGHGGGGRGRGRGRLQRHGPADARRHERAAGGDDVGRPLRGEGDLRPRRRAERWLRSPDPHHAARGEPGQSPLPGRGEPAPPDRPADHRHPRRRVRRPLP